MTKRQNSKKFLGYYNMRVNKKTGVARSTRSQGEFDSTDPDNDLFDGSPEDNQMKKVLSLFEREIRMKYNKAYLLEYSNYELAIEGKYASRVQIDDLVQNQNFYKVQEIILLSVLNVTSLIMQKIREVTQSNSQISSALRSRVVLADSTAIVDPLTSDNLCGVYTLLKEFHKATLVTFFRIFMQVISEECTLQICDSNPQYAIERITAHLKTWNSMDLDTYMDKDKLFTVLFLRSLPADSDLRKKSVLEILEYLRVIENDRESSSQITGQFKDMPVYTHIQTWISEIYVAAKNLDKQSYKHQQSTQMNYAKQNPRVIDAGTESAASVTERTLRDGPDAAAEYDVNVSREDNVWFTDPHSGARFRYVATNQTCTLCKIRGDAKNHRPLCYNGQCAKCTLVGHKTANCRQNSRGGTSPRVSSGSA